MGRIWFDHVSRAHFLRLPPVGESGKFLLVKSGAYNTIQYNTIQILLSTPLGFEIRNTAWGIRNPSNNWNPESKFHWPRSKQFFRAREKISRAVWGLSILEWKEYFKSDCNVDGTGSSPEQVGLRSHNVYRKTHGAPPLQLDRYMNGAAMIFAKKLAQKGTLQHDPPPGQGENLGLQCRSGMSDADLVKLVVDSWWVYLVNHLFIYLLFYILRVSRS